jgi:hypothetical protein
MQVINRTTKNVARRVIRLCPNRIPEFINQSRSDRNLSKTIVELNRQMLQGPMRERETAKEALVRLGFVVRDF